MVALWGAGTARADVHVLRMAAIAPEGTAWARELRAFGRDVETAALGSVKVKWYFGGIAGDEPSVLERIGRDQLDGTAGASLCERLAPSIRAARVLGLFEDRDEAAYAMRRMRPTLDEEFRAAGYVNLGEGGFGHYIVLSRTPVKSLADMRKLHWWRWDLDDVMGAQYPRLGLRSSPYPLHTAGGAYDAGKVDGFIAIPTAVLAFQWSTRARYFTELRTTFLNGCMVVTSRAFDRLSIEQQQAVRTAAAKFFVRFEDLGRQQDEMLIGGLFERQGMQRIEVSQAFRDEFDKAARASRERLPELLVPPQMLKRVVAIVNAYRAERGKQSLP